MHSFFSVAAPIAVAIVTLASSSDAKTKHPIRHALLLHGELVSTRKRDVLHAATARFGMNPMPFETLLFVKVAKFVLLTPTVKIDSVPMAVLVILAEPELPV